MADIRGVANTNTLSPVANDGRPAVALDRLGDLFLGDIKGLAARAAAAGRLVIASDGDQNDRVTGQTSFVNTTPTFLLNVPTGSLAVPLWLNLSQQGSVAGDFITVKHEIDDIAAYASGGTAETLFYVRNGAGFASSCAVYSNPTATAGYGITVATDVLAEDVDPASADAQNFRYHWEATHPLFLVGPACWKIWTYAGTTGPTFEWSLAFLDLPVAMLTN